MKRQQHGGHVVVPRAHQVAARFDAVGGAHLQPCFDHGQIELDNNAAENAIRPTKVGHKNWTFVGGKDTGWRSAVIYTLVEQARGQGADPFAYFEWVFEKLMHNPAPEELESLLPVHWLKTRPAACQTIESRVA